MEGNIKVVERDIDEERNELIAKMEAAIPQATLEAINRSFNEGKSSHDMISVTISHEGTGYAESC